MALPADRKTLLSTLWIFVFLNYIYADLFILIFSPEFYERSTTRMSAGAVVGFAVMVEALIAVVLLTRVLPSRASRWANIIGGLLGTVWVAFTLAANPPAHYVFYASVEIAATLFIVWVAWTWRVPEGAG